MTQKPFRTFVFDLDGTLLDTLPDLVVLTNDVLRELGHPERTTEEILSFVGNGVKALILQAVPEGTPEAEAERAYERWLAHYRTYENGLTRPYDGIVALLEELRARGCKVGVMSNKFEDGVHQILDSRLPGLVDAAHGECEGIPRKPDPTGVLRTIEELGGVPAEAVYVGDSPGDVAAGRSAGAYTVAVTWGYHPAERLRSLDPAPDALIGSPADLLALAPARAEA